MSSWIFPVIRADIQGMMKEKLHDVVESDVSNRIDALHAKLPRTFFYRHGHGRIDKLSESIWCTPQQHEHAA
jgi:hypothetical protein